MARVSGIGDARWTQCAGFLRCRDSADARDWTAIHPEQYALVERMARSVGVDASALVANGDAVASLTASEWTDEAAGVGLPTVTDILAELKRGGRDMRGTFDAAEFDDRVREIDDLSEGMELNGTVTNITAFGAFVDIGVHRDGLVHVSNLADHYVSDPHEIVSVGQNVRVRVLEVDRERGRINLQKTG